MARKWAAAVEERLAQWAVDFVRYHGRAPHFRELQDAASGFAPYLDRQVRTRISPNVYRKVYIEHHGEIPDGYQIHHKDGNHANNDPDNLIALSFHDHVEAHRGLDK